MYNNLLVQCSFCGAIFFFTMYISSFFFFEYRFHGTTLCKQNGHIAGYFTLKSHNNGNGIQL
ncbi:hypothetical protein EVA_13578 [gut metagenome]|uniref:Uncharacterized protein n=1 Tax=gut metagenome TaxID=749906 RepID=J9G960_9ZZZZ